jgi:hypothetical protein
VIQLRPTNTHTGSFELSLSFVGFGKNSLKTKPFYCPRF